MFIPYQKEKIENAILFFALEYRKKIRQNINQMKLYKSLAFLDFETMEEYGQPSLCLTYKAMKMGPVPKEIYIDKEYRETDAYYFEEFKDKNNTVEIIVKKNKKPDLDYFSDYEIEKMYHIAEIYYDKSVSTSDISDATHERIKAWKRRFNIKENDIISYDEDIFTEIANKKEEDFTPAEERYFMLKAFEEIKK